MRTFIALCLSVGTTRRIAEAMEKKALEIVTPKLAWVPPAQYHLTLKFMGDIPPESIDAIALRLCRRLVDIPPIGLSLKGLGVFPAAGDPRVLWVGVANDKALSTLQLSIEGDMFELGFPRGELAFFPHVTVARVPEGTLAPEAWVSDADFGQDVSAEVVVYESQQLKSHRGGVEYHARARVPFSKMR